MNRGKDIDLSDDEMAFYDVPANNESAVRDLGNQVLKKTMNLLISLGNPL